MKTKVQAGDIYISGGRSGWAERLIHFGTRRGMLGLCLGIPWFIVCVILSPNWIPLVPLAWIMASVLKLEGRSWADHAMVFIDDGELGTARCVEASMRGGVRIATPTGTAPRWVIFRVPSLSMAERGIVRQTAVRLAQKGLPYRMKLNVAFGLDYLLGLGLFNVTLFRRKLITRHANVCSVLVWRVFETAGVDGFRADPRFIDPDQLWDIGARRWLPIARSGPFREKK